MEKEREVRIAESTDLNDAHISPKSKQAEDTDSKKVKVSVDDFYAYAPENKFIHIPTTTLWPASSVDARINKVETDYYDRNGKKQFIKATEWLAKNRSVEQMTWMPGQPNLLKNKLVLDGGIVDAYGSTTFNLYKPPIVESGDPAQAGKWIEHVQNVYPQNVEHIFSWLAQRVQNPNVKINHALVLGGQQGIGKDTLLEPVTHAIGPWNMSDISPNQLMGRFNGFIKSVIIRVNEARDLGDNDRYKLYEHLKTFTASPPMVLRCDEKNRQEYSVPNLCGVIITTNHKTSGIYIPADDRRHYVAWSKKNKNDFDEKYWQKLWSWFENGGINHVAAFLKNYDLSSFDPKKPPPKTDGFWEIVDSNRAPEDAELADALDKLDNPDAVTIQMVAENADRDFYDWLNDRKNNRQIPHRFETAGYSKVRNEAANDHLWIVNGKRVAIYAKIELSKKDRFECAKNLQANVPF